MKRFDYLNRAIKFANMLVVLFNNCSCLNDFEQAIEHYNNTHSRRLRYAHGVSRLAIIRSDYVIKFDMTPEEGWENGRAGDNRTEEMAYKQAVIDGMQHLLAETTLVTIKGRAVTIMPKIDHVDDYDRNWWEYCTKEEENWLNYNICDLHEGNVGYRNGKVCVIDYAWNYV